LYNQINEPSFSGSISYAPHRDRAADYHVQVAAPTPRYVTRPEPVASNVVHARPYTRRSETEATIGARRDRHYNNFGFTIAGYDDTDCDSPAVDLDDSTGASDVTDRSTTLTAGLATTVKIGEGDGKEGDGYVTDSVSTNSMTLSCPNCLRRFSTDEHVDLMFHLDICC